MKREIKFRGKRIGYGGWVYGYVIYNQWHDKYLIDPGIYGAYPSAVDSETVGQFTGLQDRDGKDIYEGDIVQHDAWSYPVQIIFNKERACFVCDMETGLTQFIDGEQLKIVGNIHENPELKNP